MKRYIFDLDGTLLLANFEDELNFFNEILTKRGWSKEKINNFHKDRVPLIYGYEELNATYNRELLRRWFKEHKYELSEKDINDWIAFNGNEMRDTILDGAIEVLEYLKSKDKEIVLLTNWFMETQENRLKRAGLLDYFDYLVTGEMAIKPRRASYAEAAALSVPWECVMIGDNWEKDYLGPTRYLMNTHYVGEVKDTTKKVKQKKLIELIGGED